MQVFFAIAAENAFTVTSAFIEALYPAEVLIAAPTSDGLAKPSCSIHTVVVSLLAVVLGH